MTCQVHMLNLVVFMNFIVDCFRSSHDILGLTLAARNARTPFHLSRIARYSYGLECPGINPWTCIHCK